MTANPNLILPVGTMVVIRVPIQPDGGPERPEGTVGVIARAPADAHHAYRIRMPDGAEVSLGRDQIGILKHYQREGLEREGAVLEEYDLWESVIYRCVVGSRAYGLSQEGSDTDLRGIYLAPARLHFSLYGAPEQLEGTNTDEVYWELQKFLNLALKANPNVLEVLYSPRVETTTPLAEELLGMREIFLSKMVYQTYSRYVMSQFKKMTRRLEKDRELNWKHAMHLIRLLHSGITIMREGFVPVRVDASLRDRLLAIRNGESSFEEVDRWRLALHEEFDEIFAKSPLPERPDYEAANDLLVRARRLAARRLEAQEPKEEVSP